MALSVINFRMPHGSVEQVSFSGNGMKLIDLKKEITEKKKFSSSIDYDLTVSDESGKGYFIIFGNSFGQTSYIPIAVFIEDDEIVPKNASVLVKRIPVKNSNMSLISRLKRREAQPHSTHFKSVNTDC